MKTSTTKIVNDKMKRVLCPKSAKLKRLLGQTVTVQSQGNNSPFMKVRGKLRIAYPCFGDADVEVTGNWYGVDLSVTDNTGISFPDTHIVDIDTSANVIEIRF